MKTPLLSKRLNLIPVENSDEDFLFTLLRIPAIKKYLLDNEDIQIETVKKFIEESNALFQKSDIGLWIVKQLISTNVIGLCGFFYSDLLELLYIIHPDYQKNGFATEACNTVINYINNLEIQDEIYAKIDIPNKESHVVAKKIGMKEVKEEINKNTNGMMKVYKLE